MSGRGNVGIEPVAKQQVTERDVGESRPPAAPARRVRSWQGNAVSFGVALTALAASLLVTVMLVAFQGQSPWNVFQAMFHGAFGTSQAWGATLYNATPLLFAAVAFIVAQRAGLINLGIDGQMYLGGAAAVAVALATSRLPGMVVIPLALAAAVAAGAAWSGLAGAAKVRLGVSEIITTFLMTFLAIQLVLYLLSTPTLLADSQAAQSGQRLEQSAFIATDARLPRLLGQAHVGLVVALALALGAAAAYRWTRFGFRLRMLGYNAEAARQGGVAVGAMTLLAMLLSGAVGGLAGGSLVLGNYYRLVDQLSPGYGFDGIVVALVARSSLVGAVVSAILFGALRTGGQYAEAAVQVPGSLFSIVQGIAVLTVVGIGYYVDRRRANGATWLG